MVINLFDLFGFVFELGMRKLVKCRLLDSMVSFFSTRSVKSILKNAPKRQEREDDQMMELDPLEPDDEGVVQIVVFKILF